jgi:hypothetical protein
MLQCRLAMGPRVGRRGVAKWGSVRVVAGWGYSRFMALWGVVVIWGRRSRGGREDWRGLPVTEAGFSLEPESVA